MQFDDACIVSINYTLYGSINFINNKCPVDGTLVPVSFQNSSNTILPSMVEASRLCASFMRRVLTMELSIL